MKSRDAILVIFVAMLVCSINTGSLLVSADGTVTPEGPYIDTLMFKVLSGIPEEVPALLNGEIDLIGEMVTTDYLDMLTTDPNIAIDSVPRNGYGYFVINCDRYPLNETALRRAWAFALDKQRISDEVWNGYSSLQDSLVPRGNPFSIEEQLTYHYYDANPTEGNRLLDEAGFLDIDDDGYREAPDGSDFTVVLNTADISPISMGCGDIGTDALLSLGIDVLHEPIPFNNYLQRVQYGRHYDAAFFGRNFLDLSVDWLAFEYWSEMAYDPTNNYPNFMNDTYDSWRDQLLHSADYSEVYEAAIEMQRILVYQCPQIVAYNNLQFSAYRTDRFEGHVLDSIDGIHGWWTNQKVHLKDSEGGPIGGTFTKSLPWGLSSYNPLTIVSTQDISVHEMLWDSLLRQDSNGALIPWLAESYTSE
ncbi:hypothetical protein EU528_01155, partial [Candidatus Thorarchaeota archaeon]